MEGECQSEIRTDAVPLPPRASPPNPKPPNSHTPPISSPSASASAHPLATINGASLNTPGTSINISNCSYIQFGNSLVFNSTQTVVQGQSRSERSKRNGFSKSKNAEKNPSVELLMDSKQEVSLKYMILISKNLGEGWRSVFRSMGYKDGFIETMFESHKHEGITEVIYQMLLDWIRNPEEDGDERTLGELSNILWGWEKYELVQQLADLYQEPNSEEKS